MPKTGPPKLIKLSNFLENLYDVGKGIQITKHVGGGFFNPRILRLDEEILIINIFYLQNHIQITLVTCQ